MAKFLITGGTGLVGKRLIDKIVANGDEAVYVSRTCKQQKGCFEWNVKAQTMDINAFSGVDYLVHLAGAGIADKRWDAKRKQEIIDSRVNSTKLLIDTIKKNNIELKGAVAASAIGFYGTETTPKVYKEEDGPEKGYLAHVVKLWEEATSKFRELGVATTQLRIGVVLAKEGGALKEMTNPPVLAALGHGKQNIPWVHIDDLCDMILWSLDNKKNTVYNAVGPEYVNNKQFMKTISMFSPKPLMPINAPAFVLKLMLGEMASLVLEGSKISSEKIQKEGFRFSYETAQAALKECLQS